MNMSDELTWLVSVRCAGVPGINPGERLGGVYYPAVLNPDGTIKTSARFQTAVYVNRKGRRDSQTGEMIEGRRDILSLTFWNTRQSPAGKGLADIAAKCISEGKEITCRALAHSYDSVVRNIDGSVVMRSDGQGPLTKRATGFSVVPGSLMLGQDADKVITREVQNYNGEGNFHSRPQYWNVQKTPDNEAWKKISEWRMSQTYQGGSTYGYARVQQPGQQQGIAQPAINAGTVAGAVNPNPTFPNAAPVTPAANPTFPTFANSAQPQAAGMDNPF